MNKADQEQNPTGQQPSIFERMETSRVAAQEIDDNLIKLAKFFLSYTKNKQQPQQQQGQQGVVTLKDEHIQSLYVRMRQMQKNLKKIITEMEIMFDELSAEKDQLKREKEQQIQELKQQHEQELLKCQQEFETQQDQQYKNYNQREETLKKTIKEYSDSLDQTKKIWHHNLECMDSLTQSHKQKLQQNQAQHFQRLSNMENDFLVKITDMDNLIQSLKQINKSKQQQPNRATLPQKLKNLQNIEIGEQKMMMFDKISPINQINKNKEIVLNSYNIINNSSNNNNNNNNINQKDNSENLGYEEKEETKSEDNNQTKEMLEMIGANESYESKEFQQLNLFENANPNNQINDSNISMKKVDCVWDSQLDSEESETSIEGNDIILNAIEVLDKHSFFSPQNLPLLQKFSELSENPIDKNSYLQLILQIFQLKVKQSTIKQKSDNDKKDLSGQIQIKNNKKKAGKDAFQKNKQQKILTDTQDENSTHSKQKKKKNSLKQKSNNNKELTDICLNDLMEVEDVQNYLSFESPLPSLNKSLENDIEKQIQYKDVQKNDILNVKSCNELSILMEKDENSLSMPQVQIQEKIIINSNKFSNNQSDDKENFLSLKNCNLNCDLSLKKNNNNNIINNNNINEHMSNSKIKVVDELKNTENNKKKQYQINQQQQQQQSNNRIISLESSDCTSRSGSCGLLSQQREMLYRDNEILVEDGMQNNLQIIQQQSAEIQLENEKECTNEVDLAQNQFDQQFSDNLNNNSISNNNNNSRSKERKYLLNKKSSEQKNSNKYNNSNKEEDSQINFPVKSHHERSRSQSYMNKCSFEQQNYNISSNNKIISNNSFCSSNNHSKSISYNENEIAYYQNILSFPLNKTDSHCKSEPIILNNSKNSTGVAHNFSTIFQTKEIQSKENASNIYCMTYPSYVQNHQFKLLCVKNFNSRKNNNSTKMCSQLFSKLQQSTKSNNNNKINNGCSNSTGKYNQQKFAKVQDNKLYGASPQVLKLVPTDNLKQ